MGQHEFILAFTWRSELCSLRSVKVRGDGGATPAPTSRDRSDSSETLLDVLGGFLEPPLATLLFEGLHVEVDTAFLPLLVLFDGERSGQS